MTTVTSASGNIYEIADACNAVVSTGDPLICPWCPPGRLHRKLFRAAAVFNFGAYQMFLCATHRPSYDDAYQYLTVDEVPMQLKDKAIDIIYMALAHVTQGCIEPDIAKEIAIKCVNEAIDRQEPK